MLSAFIEAQNGNIFQKSETLQLFCESVKILTP